MVAEAGYENPGSEISKNERCWKTFEHLLKHQEMSMEL